jgi:hypothetical protein
LKQRLSDCCCRTARATSVTDLAWPFPEPAIREVQRPAVRLSQHFKTFLYIFYSFILCQKKFNDSPLFTPRITLPRHLDETLSMREKICLATQQ